MGAEPPGTPSVRDPARGGVPAGGASPGPIPPSQRSRLCHQSGMLYIPFFFPLIFKLIHFMPYNILEDYFYFPSTPFSVSLLPPILS